MTSKEILLKFLNAHIKITDERVGQIGAILNSYGENKETFYDALKAVHVIEGQKLGSLISLREKVIHQIHQDSASPFSP